MSRRIWGIIAAALWLFAAGAVCAEGLDIGALTPQAMPGEEVLQPVALYCGPTQGSYRHGEQVIDLSEPFVYFGQHDCWAMVASGTPDALGVVGWVESAAMRFPDAPQLTFDDALLAMVEEDTFLTDSPMADAPAQLMALARGDEVTLLAQLGDWAYVQTELAGAPVRGFVPATAIL